jgi:hypothetical protein
MIEVCTAVYSRSKISDSSSRFFMCLAVRKVNLISHAVILDLFLPLNVKNVEVPDAVCVACEVFTLILSWLKWCTSTSIQKQPGMNARCENVIPEMVAASRWGVESGKIMYPNTFGYVPTYV